MKQTVMAMLVALCGSAAACGQKVTEVDSSPGYNCWPMIQPVGDRLVCILFGRFHQL